MSWRSGGRFLEVKGCMGHVEKEDITVVDEDGRLFLGRVAAGNEQEEVFLEKEEAFSKRGRW